MTESVIVFVDGSSLTAEQRKAAEERLDSDQNLDDATQSGSDSSSSSDENEDIRTSFAEKTLQEHRHSRRSFADHHNYSVSKTDSQRTDTWEVLKGEVSTDHEGPSLEQIEAAGSVASWKSARNGGSRRDEPVDMTPNALCKSIRQTMLCPLGHKLRSMVLIFQRDREASNLVSVRSNPWDHHSIFVYATPPLLLWAH